MMATAAGENFGSRGMSNYERMPSSSGLVGNIVGQDVEAAGIHSKSSNSALS